MSLSSPVLRAGGGTTHPELKTDETALQDFADRRVGLMIHWGPCTTIPTEISWGMGNRASYEQKYQSFNPGKLDLDQWASVAQKLGAKYAILVAKHHDGYCLWKTKTTDKSTYTSPLHRDVTAEFTAAMRKQGILPGAYLSIIDVTKQNSSGVSDSKLPPNGIQELFEYTDQQVAELMSQYNPAILWFDGHWVKDWTPEVASELYQRMKQRNPKILACRMMVMPRDQSGHEVWSRSVSVGDFHSMEARVGNYLPDPWEVVTSVSYPNYSWRPNAKLKTPEEIVKLIVQITTGNGNLLLNFMPNSEGVIDDAQVQLATSVGEWLKIHGSAVYHTRGGPWYPSSWGGSTYRGSEAFIHVLPNAPERLLLSACEAKVQKAALLDGTTVKFQQGPEGKVTIELPKSMRRTDATVVKLTLDRPITSMVADRAERSIFDDPEYGSIVSRNASIKLSSTSNYDRPEQHAMLVGEVDSKEGYAFHTNEETEPFITLDLGKPCFLRGIEIQNRAGYESRAGKPVVLLSLDGEKWTETWKAETESRIWSVPLIDFHDHSGEQQGLKARYVRIQTRHDKPNAFHLNKVKIYGVPASSS